MMATKTRIRSTMQQINLLMEYMETHPRLANGEFYGAVGKLEEQGEWAQLRAVLNEHGPDKSIDQWKVTWRDLRRKQRTEGHTSANQSGGCSGNITTVPVSSDQTIKILNVMSSERAFDKHDDDKSAIESFLKIQTEDEQPDHHTLVRKRKFGHSSTAAESSKSSTETINANTKELTEFDAIGINTAIKISKMDSVQAIYVESLITNVLRRGLLNKLTDDTHLCDECSSNNN